MIDLLIWMAILPSAILMYRVLRLDKIESEPARLLLRVFALGGIGCIPAGIIEGFGDNLLMRTVANPATYSLLLYMALVPCAEEGVKYVAMRSVRNRPEFNYTFDGIVYGVMASLGFATIENLMYVLGLFDFGVAVARAFLSVPLHCVCGVFMGYYYGLAHRHKALGQTQQASTNRLMSYLVPVFIHGLYDYSLDMQNTTITMVGFGFTLVMFFLAIRRVRLSSQQDEAFWGGYQQ